MIGEHISERRSRLWSDYRLALQLPAGPLPPIWTGLLHCIDERLIDLHALLAFAGPALSNNG